MSDQKPAEKGLALIKKVLTGTDVMQRFSSLMGDREAAYYINSVILAVANSSDLQECTPQSIVYSALRAATLKLSCDPSTGEAYLIPFNNNQKGVREAAFVPGYKGLKNLALRTGKYRFINVTPVYNGERVVEDRISGALHLTGGKISNEVIGWLAYFEMVTGFSKALFMTVEEIHDHAAANSKTYNSKKSRWQIDPPAMERKTVLRVLLNRWADLGAGVASLLSDEDIVNTDIPFSDAGAAPVRDIKTAMGDLGFDNVGGDGNDDVPPEFGDAAPTEVPPAAAQPPQAPPAKKPEEPAAEAASRVDATRYYSESNGKRYHLPREWAVNIARLANVNTTDSVADFSGAYATLPYFAEGKANGLDFDMLTAILKECGMNIQLAAVKMRANVPPSSN